MFNQVYSNANDCFKDAGFAYLPDCSATNNCNLKRFKYLQTKFKNVSVVLVNDDVERYRIGSMDENAILGKDYVLIEKNLKYSPWFGYIWNSILNGTTNLGNPCWYGLVEKGNKKSLINNYKTFNNYIYTKLFRTFKGMSFWTSKKFPQFNKSTK